MRGAGAPSPSPSPFPFPRRAGAGPGPGPVPAALWPGGLAGPRGPRHWELRGGARPQARAARRAGLAGLEPASLGGPAGGTCSYAGLLLCRFQRTVLDLSVQWRFAKLPNNAKLEMVPVSCQRADAEDTVRPFLPGARAQQRAVARRGAALGPSRVAGSRPRARPGAFVAGAPLRRDEKLRSRPLVVVPAPRHLAQERVHLTGGHVSAAGQVARVGIT